VVDKLKDEKIMTTHKQMVRCVCCSVAAEEAFDLTTHAFVDMVQGPCFDFVQSPYRDLVKNNTLFNCMKDKMAAGLPACDATGAMVMAMGVCGGGGQMRRGGNVSVSCSPGPPPWASISLSKDMYESILKGIFKGMAESRCDADSKIDFDDKERYVGSHTRSAAACIRGNKGLTDKHGHNGRSWTLSGELWDVTSKLDGKGTDPVPEAKMAVLADYLAHVKELPSQVRVASHL